MFALFALLSFNACSPQKTNDAEISKDQTDKNKTELTKTSEDKKAESKNIAELLKGKWQHEEDKSNYLVFDKNLRKEIAEGLDKWDEEPFVLSDACMNAGDVNPEIPKEKDRYISVAESDLCWYIIDVNENRLTLSYMGRGNTLKYNRVKPKGE